MINSKFETEVSYSLVILHAIANKPNTVSVKHRHRIAIVINDNTSSCESAQNTIPHIRIGDFGVSDTRNRESPTTSSTGMVIHPNGTFAGIPRNINGQRPISVGLEGF